MRKTPVFISIVISLGLMFSFQNCGTDLGDPAPKTKLQIEISAYDNGVATWWHKFFSPAYAAVADLQVCGHQLQIFKAQGEEGENLTIDLESRWIDVVSTGTVLVNDASLVPGVYRRMDLKLRDNCDLGQSLVVQNDNGTFTSDRPVNLRFEGEIIIEEEEGTVVLSIQPFIDYLDTVTSDNDIAPGLNSIQGEIN